MHPRHSQLPLASDLIDVAALVEAYWQREIDPHNPLERVVFGTSGHRGCALRGCFNEPHIIAVCCAIAAEREAAGVQGPLYLGADTHALSAPALQTAIATLLALGVHLRVSSGAGDAAYVPTPALSLAILRHNRELAADSPLRADGIIITPSHNPPADGGIKYNPPHAGPADSDVTARIAAAANQLLMSGKWRKFSAACAEKPAVTGTCEGFDFLENYVAALPDTVDMAAISQAGVRFAVHPLGGASIAYWAAIRDRYQLNLTVLGEGADPQFAFLHLDFDGKLRMDPSSAAVMSTVTHAGSEFALIIGNDADADRHGIVTAPGGLMNPNHFLAVAIDYLLRHRPLWPKDAGVGKTAVSSALIDRVVRAHGRQLAEVPVGFKWFVPGLSSGKLLFGGEESAGAAFLCRDGRPWVTDKDGMQLGLLAAEIMAVTAKSPAELYRELVAQHGDPAYARIDCAATAAQKAQLLALAAHAVSDAELAGEKISAVATVAANGEALGGLKVTTANAWFAARPSGTEDVLKIYAESFIGPEHLRRVQMAAEQLVATNCPA